MKIKPLYRGIVGTFLMLLLGSMYTWSYFKVSLGEAYPAWSQTQLTLNFTILMICFCLGGLVAGSMLSGLRKPLQVCLAAVLMGVGFFGVSLLPENPNAALIQMYICYGVLTGLGTGIAYNAVLSSIQPWFPQVAGMISGVLLMGMGFGSLLLGGLASAALKVLSLRMTFRLFGIGALALLLICAPVIRPPRPEELTADAEGQAAVSETYSYKTTEMLKRPTFWLYFIWNIMLSAGGMLVINSASSISVFYGLSAVIGLVVSVFNGLGRLAIGGCMDRLGWKKTMYLNNGILLCSGVLLLLGDRAEAGFIVLVGMLVMGVCYGGGITISASLIRSLYGPEHYAANFSVCNLCVIPASILGPMISASLQDGSGAYFSTFVMVLVIGLVALGLNVFIRKP
ncbi:MAG: MFS transporter [Oscillospiraceae bacterium]|nr:MFS transporter [Oscillospiraceae bacterium]